MGSAIDPQVRGWRDIGDPEGAVATVRADADLVMVPFRTSNHYLEPFGDGGGTLQANVYTSNPDGTGSGYNLSTTTAGTTHALRIWVPFNGRCFGVRWLSQNTTPDFTVVVDGEAVNVEGWPSWLTREGITTQLTFSRAMALTHDHLDPTKHHIAQINLVGVEGAVRTMVMFGFLLDRRFAFEHPRDYVHVTPPGTLTTSAVAIPLTNGAASDRALRAIRKVFYRNTDSVARIVTIKNGATLIATIYLAAAGTTGDTGSFDPGGDWVISSSITHQADAGSVVTYQVIGAQ